MAVQHQCGNEYGCPCPRGVRHHEEGEDGCADGGDQCSEGGDFETERHNQPNQGAEQGGCWGEGEQDAQCGGYAFAAFKIEKYWPHMANQCGNRDQGYRCIRQI